MERSTTMIKAKAKAKSRKPKAKKKRSGPALTKLAHEMGVSISTVWRWENDGVPGKGPIKDWREKHLRDALKKLGDQPSAA